MPDAADDAASCRSWRFTRVAGLCKAQPRPTPTSSLGASSYLSLRITMSTQAAAQMAPRPLMRGQKGHRCMARGAQKKKVVVVVRDISLQNNDAQ